MLISRPRSLLALGLASAAITITASPGCSSQGGPSSSSSGSGVGGVPGGGGSGGSDLAIAAVTGGGGDNTTCVAEPHQAMPLPLDMYIMLDQSASMDEPVAGGVTKWKAVTTAIDSFLMQPGLGAFSAGIQYFALPQDKTCPFMCVVDADCGKFGPCEFLSNPNAGHCTTCFPGNNDSCVAVDYATPEVEIAALPGAASAILASIKAHKKHLSSTPTAPALQGAVAHVKDWATTHPGHAVVAVLVTDGMPTECGEDPIKINAIAAAGANGTPKARTFVIGVFPEGDLASAKIVDGIAAAGGTGKAFVIQTTEDVNQAFLLALNQIRGAALSCYFDIPKPSSGAPDYTRVNVQYTPGNGGAKVVFAHYPDAAHCPAGNDGWYYDNDASPSQILLCPGACGEVSADLQGKVEILLGCTTKTPK